MRTMEYARAFVARDPFLNAQTVIRDRGERRRTATRSALRRLRKLATTVARVCRPTSKGGTGRVVTLCVLAMGALCMRPAISNAQPVPTPVFTPAPGSPFSTGQINPTDLAFSPDGKLLATDDGLSTLRIYSVASDGALTQITDEPFAGDNQSPLAFSRTGTLLAVVEDIDDTAAVAVYSVAADGALAPAPGSPFPVSGATSIAFSPTGDFLAVADAGSNTVSIYDVTPDGTLTQLSGSPFATGPNPVSLAFSPDGRFLAVGNFSLDIDGQPNEVSVYSVASTGTLTPVSNSPFATSDGLQVAFAAGGRLLIVPDFGNPTLDVFNVDASGALTPVTGSPFDTGAPNPDAIAVSPDGIVLASPDGGDYQARIFTIDATGGLTQAPDSPLPFGAPISAPGGPVTAVFSPSGNLLAVANVADDTITMFSYTLTAAPFAIAAPSLGGWLVPGQPLSCSTGDWINAPTAFLYQWTRDQTAIPGETNSAYTILTQDEGHQIACYVTGVNASGQQTDSSSASAVPLDYSPSATSAPGITGGALAGTTVTCSPGTWTNTPSNFTFQWQADDIPIAAATSQQYVVPSRLLGLVLTCKVSAFNNSGSGSAISPPATVTAAHVSLHGTPLRSRGSHHHRSPHRRGMSRRLIQTASGGYREQAIVQ